jgi:DNA-binding transcriptional MocR family regulator
MIQYNEILDRHLNLNMARGKPSPEQLDLSMDMLHYPKTFHTAGGVDVRNYGVLEGIPECRQLFGELLGICPDQIILGGTSSLNLMFDTMAALHLFGTQGHKPWSSCLHEGKPIRFLCPVPGYDRHFRICEELNMEMIPVPLLDDGPDMDMVCQLVRSDPSIKGIWCVPLHSNPQGVCYSDEVVHTLASMETAAPDFRIFWDNAYFIHHIYESPSLLNILDECEKCKNPDRAYYFFSTSKITFPGAGVSMIAASPANIAEMKKHMSAQFISHDKINQLRHAEFFKNADGMRKHMEKLAQILRPKFDIVLNKLDSELGGSNLAVWSRPKGGYFISLNTLPDCASRVVELAKNAGVILTEAGATYPYGKDPTDSNIRIAPSYPSENELLTAVDVLILCIKIASDEIKEKEKM